MELDSLGLTEKEFDVFKNKMNEDSSVFQEREVLAYIIHSEIGIQLVCQNSDESEKSYFDYEIVKYDGLEWTVFKSLSFKLKDIVDFETFKFTFPNILKFYQGVSV